jgi:transcriptional regulator with XRE-family HTH domain
MQTLLHTEFAALLDRADVRQAAFARLTGVTPRQVNNWCRGRAAVPRWAALLAAVLGDISQEALVIRLEETTFLWHETLGVPPNAEAGAVRSAMAALKLIDLPDTDGRVEQRTRIDRACEAACAAFGDSDPLS